MTLLSTAVQEFWILVFIGVFSTWYNFTVRYVYYPGSFPFNMVFNFAAVSTVSPDVILGPDDDFSWTALLVRILTDIVVIVVGFIAFQAMFVLFAIDYKYAEDPSSLLTAIDKTSNFGKGVVLILYYISNFSLFGSYRLAWNALCIPFIRLFAAFMQLISP